MLTPLSAVAGSSLRRRPRFLRRRGLTPRGELGLHDLALQELMADLAALDPPRPEPEAGIDPQERALLMELYRELVGTVDGPIVPFPVELMEDPDCVEERPAPAALLDLAAFRAKRRPRTDPTVELLDRHELDGHEAGRLGEPEAEAEPLD